MTAIKRGLGASAFTSFFLLWGNIAHAVAPLDGGGLRNPLKNISSFPDFIAAILNLLVTVGIPIAAVFFIFAGFKFVTARGNENDLTVAKNALVGAIIGTAILVGAKVLASVIATTINSL
jgi:hypothetical protein